MNRPGKESDKTSTVIKALSLVLVLAGVGWWGWATYSRYQGLKPEPPPPPTVASPAAQGAPAPPTDAGPRRGGPPSPEEFREAARGAMDEVGFSADQRTRIEALFAQGPPQSREEWEERRREMEQIATPEQMEQFRNVMRRQMRARILGEAQAKLSPEDYQAFEKRIEERMNRRGGRRGGGPDGPPPDGPPPGGRRGD